MMMMWRVLVAVLVVGGVCANADTTPTTTTTTPIPISPASLVSSTSTPPVAAPRRVDTIGESTIDVDGDGAPTTSCRFPGAPAHSTVTFTDETLRVDAVATYTCERGFELLGPARRTCTGGGVWTPDGVPFCVLNVAAGKAPMQTSTEGGGIPQRAIDGSTSTFFTTDTCTLTRPERVPWWYVNLLEPYMVQLVRLDFGRSCCGPNKPATIVVRVGNNRPDLGTNPICNRFTGFLEEGHPLFLPCNPPMPGAFVSVHLELGSGEPEQLSICEAFVYTDQALPIERCPQFRDQPPGSTATYNGKCYIFYNRQPVKFRDALTFCRSRGGTLVDESNPALQGFISWELWRRHRSDTNSQYWMGAVRDPKDRTNWKWLSGDDVTVSFWNLPGGNEDCARYDGSKGWLWSDTNCNLNLNYICQHQPKACGRPEQPPNSTMVAQSFDVGASVDYACDDGHLLVGPTTRTCLETGFYNEFPPVCKRIECGFPADIPNGNYRLINGSVGYLSQVMYGCDDGFEMVGRAQLTCDIDERWNGPPPRCEAIQCEPPPTIQFGKYSMSNNRSIFGTVVEYYCSRGYRLHGPKQIVCLPSGQYDRVPPNCKEDKSTPGVGQTRRPTSHRPTDPSSSSTTTTTTRKTARPTRPSITTYPPLVAPPVTVDDDVEPGTVREERPHRRPAIRPIGSQPTRVTVPPSPPSSKGTGAYRPNKNDDADRHPQDNEIPNTISDRQDESANAHVPLSVDGAERREPFAARLNLGAIIALGAFGGFVFLAAIVTMIVILIRRNQPGKHYRHRASPDCNTVASFDSSSTTNSRHGALNRYYRQAWQNLHDSAAGSPDATKGGGGGGGRGRAANHSPLRRKETLDEPVSSSSYRGAAAVRDDAAVRDETREKKRHHHHHHHHDERPRGGQTPGGGGGGGGVDRHGKEWRASGNGHREHRKY